MALFVFRKFILQTRMRSHLAGLDVWLLVGPFDYFNTSCMRTAKALARLRRIAWAFAGRLCNKYYNLMGWLESEIMVKRVDGQQLDKLWDDYKAG